MNGRTPDRQTLDRRTLDRRTLLRTVATAGVLASAGCLAQFGLDSDGTTAAGDGSGNATGGDGGGQVHYPPHVHGMEMAGMAAEPPYKVGVMLANPHRFWEVAGTDLVEHPIEDQDVHLMAVVWHPDSGVVLPEAGVSLEVTRDGELVSEEVIYPMLSQRMGFHYGGNFALPADGTYTATVRVGGVSVRRTGSFDGLFEGSASFGVEFDYSRRTMNGLPYNPLPEKDGQPGAVEPMEMMMPNAIAPAEGDLPGEVLGSATTGDAVLVATAVRDADRLPGSPYLAVSARTPYNRMVLPMMGLSATLERDGETVFDGVLERTLDPELDYHYGAAVDSVESGDVLTLTVDTPPQVARHLGYQTAFLDMPDVEIEV